MTNQFDRYRSAPVGHLPTGIPQTFVNAPQQRSGARRDLYRPYNGTPEEKMGQGFLETAGKVIGTAALFETVDNLDEDIQNKNKNKSSSTLGDPSTRKTRKARSFDDVVGGVDRPLKSMAMERVKPDTAGDGWDFHGNGPQQGQRALGAGPQVNWAQPEPKALDSGPRVFAPQPIRAIEATSRTTATRPVGKKPLMLGAGPRQQFGSVSNDLSQVAELSGGKIVGRGPAAPFADPSTEKGTRRRAGGNIAGMLKRRAYGD